MKSPSFNPTARRTSESGPNRTSLLGLYIAHICHNKPYAKLMALHALITMISSVGDVMASMTIRDLDDRLKARLRVRAARNSRSMEEEVRAILKAALMSDQGTSKSLIKAIRARIEPLGGVEIAIAPREPIRDVELK